MPCCRLTVCMVLGVMPVAACTHEGKDADGDTDTVPLELIASLSAVVSEEVGSIVVVTWDQRADANVHLEFSFEKGSWLSSRTRSLAAGPQRDLILGVPYGETVTWRLVAEGSKDPYTSPDATIATALLPSGVPANTVTVSEPELQDETAPFWFVGIASSGYYTDTWWTLIVDRQGRVLWALETPSATTSMHAHVGREGKTLLLDRTSYWRAFDHGAASYIDEVTIDATVLRTFDVPGMHHPFDQLPDGSIAYGAAVAAGREMLTIVHVDGTTEDLWDCSAWRKTISDFDVCSSNTLRYDEGSNKFLFSFYNFNTIVEIDRDTASVDRWWGHAPGSYAFDPDDSAFWWQHGGYITSTGTLLTSTDLAGYGGATMVREYEIDDQSQTLHEIWNYGIDDGLYGGVMGEATRLPNGNTERNVGGIARMQEVAPDGTLVWDIEWDAGTIGRSTSITDLYDLAP